MKVFGNYLILLSVIVLSVTSCGKRVAPATSSSRQNKKYDAAAFNYFYVEAIKQKLTGNVSDALKYLDQCVKLNPESDASYYQMAQIAIANGDISVGKQFTAKALEIDQKNLWYIMTMASLYYQEKKLDSAIIFYKKAVKYYPDTEKLKLTLGNLYSENGNYEKANEIFNSFDNKYGVNETSTLSAVKNLMAEKKYDDALEKVQLLLKTYPNEVLYNGLLAEIYKDKGESIKALEIYKNLLDSNPDDPQTQLALCDFFISEKNYDDLFTLLNTVIINDKIKKEDKISLFARLIEIPDLYKDRGDKLLVDLMLLEAIYKNDDIIPLIRPELLIKQEKLDEASDCLEEIIKNKPENYFAWEKLLLVYLQMGDYVNLMKKGEECATNFNRSFLAKILYATGAMENKKFDIALDELRKAQILAGDNKDYLNQVFTLRADVYYRMKDYLKAFEIFDEILKTNKDDYAVLNNYAYYLAEQNMKLKEAEVMAKKVIEKEKTNTTYLDTYAWVLYKRKKYNEASRIMESIIKSKEKPNAEWYEHYGFILKKKKDCEKAIENWNIAILLDSTKTNLIKEIENCKK